MQNSKAYLAGENLINEMAQALGARLDATQVKDPAMIGIHTGGAWLAGHLHITLTGPGPLQLFIEQSKRDSREGKK